MTDSAPHRESQMSFDKERAAFDQVAITVASPDIIRSWSKGEVTNPETINYRTFKPEKGGLFCERIFGPTRDMECACGKYKRIKHKGQICDRCQVEVTNARVRRERMGHIELEVPVSHIWFYKCMPSRIGLMLDMTARELERVLYYEDYVVIDPKSTPLLKGQVISEDELRDAEDEYGDYALNGEDADFHAGMGAEAIQEMLKRINLELLIVDLEEEMQNTRSKQNKRKLAKRLKLAQGFLSSNTRPEWMILNILPVIPPDLRPLVPLEGSGGRFATSDLNDLYRRVINRNNRLKNLKQLKTPEVIIRNEKRMLQEAVDALFDNGRHGRAVTGAANRPLKSLSDMLKGKGGRFRQNLLGKRVDYSGRSVIVIGPDLKLHQCGLPKKMALILFEPFIIRRLKEMGYVQTVRTAKKMIDRKDPVVWDILEEVTKGHPVLLNRAPTLHRLSIQAFEPVLIEGNAIRVHPLVCTAYNADFDGDQMAVHVPLSVETQLEARQLMLAPNNIFSPASGKPITTPSQDIILGSYYLTFARALEVADHESDQSGLSLFDSISEVEFAIANRKLKYHDWIRLRNPDFGKDTVYGNKDKRVIVTTGGRVRFNEIWPNELGFINKNITKKAIGEIIWKCYQTVGKTRTVTTLDSLKNLGFKEATRSGCSIGIVDMVVPEDKHKEIAHAYSEVEKVSKQYRNGIITDGERYQKIVDIWTQTTDKIQTSLYRKLEHNEGAESASPLYMMVDSGARGNKAQIKQLSGMRGLMAKPSGEIIERPITSNFREGLSVLEYFISTHGARKGLADTALKTADSGYMTRKLVDVAQDVIVFSDDCGTNNGIIVKGISDGDQEVASLSSRIYGRVSCERVTDPVTGEIIVDVDGIISEKQSHQIENLGVEQLKIRSVLTCEATRGCCAKCYGLNLATGREVRIGEAVGIIAAQSIGEPGTQLTMRTFHVGGTATTAFKQPIVQTKNEGRVAYSEDLRYVQDSEGNFVVLNKNGIVSLCSDSGEELESYQVVVGSVIYAANGSKVEKGKTLITWDPYNVPVISEKSGKIEFKDMHVGITVSKDVDKETGATIMVVTDHKQDLHPSIVIKQPKTGEVLASYAIPSGANLVVKDKSTITAGTLLAKTPRKVAKTKDITGGLPRVAELFEARKPKDACTISRLDGEVSFGEKHIRGKKVIRVSDKSTGEYEDHLVSPHKHIVVHNGDRVKRGDQLTEGSISPDEILEVSGAAALKEHLVNEVQSVYRLQGVEINDKHVEIIVRQMLRKVKITDPGDTQFLWGDQIERTTFNRINKKIEQEGGEPAKAEAILLGITKASLETESFISAASFQDTTRVLTEASTLGKVDTLEGFKENVIMGHLIPAGTGFQTYRGLVVEPAEGAQPIDYYDDEEEEDEDEDEIFEDVSIGGDDE